MFDPETVTDHATFKELHQFSNGEAHVFVNGVQVLKAASTPAPSPAGSFAARAGKATSSRSNPVLVQPPPDRGLIGHAHSEEGRCFPLAKRDGVAHEIAFAVCGLNLAPTTKIGRLFGDIIYTVLTLECKGEGLF